MPLGLRLKLIASLVPDGARVCDIGTDHAYLPIELIKSGKAISVIATDIREKPLENARKNIQKSGVTEIDLRLCDGLSAVEKSETDSVIIAGMGGEVISGIISRAKWLKEKPYTLLILQPTTSPEDLRRFLITNCFEITSDTAISENGKLYSVMTAVFTGNKISVPEYFYYVGKVDPKTEDGFLYIQKQYRRVKACADALYGIPEKKTEYQHFKELSDRIGRLLNYGE